jgi:ribosomal protein S18 acetylase RimI-like enzyme
MATGGPEVVETFPAADGVDLPPGFVIRRIRRPDDYRAMNRIANAVREARGDAFTTTDEQFAAYYDTNSRFEADRDVAVIMFDGRLVGYLRGGVHDQVDGQRLYEILPFLDPTLDAEAMYSAMLGIMETHLRALAAVEPEDTAGPRRRVFETFGGDLAPGLERLILAAGFEPVRHEYAMVRPHLEDLPDAPLPDGLEIREVWPEHLRQIWEAGVEAFSDMWGASVPSEEDYLRSLSDPIESQTELWRVAWDGDEVAGQVRSYINPVENERFGRKRGYTEGISVRRPWRRRGLARALIGASFPLLRARGMTEAALGVDTENVSGALRVYERCGFVPVSRSTTYRKPLA